MSEESLLDQYAQIPTFPSGMSDDERRQYIADRFRYDPEPDDPTKEA